jgi:hypothetical protein
MFLRTYVKFSSSDAGVGVFASVEDIVEQLGFVTAAVRVRGVSVRGTRRLQTLLKRNSIN